MTTIEIWSDVMCPFCYIGKRHLEAALAEIPEKRPVKIVWRSYQLDPDVQPAPGVDIYTYLADRKGISREQSIEMHRQVSNMAQQAGLEYHFDRVVIANSFDAHRLIHLAKQHDLADAAEERIFRAYFTEGKDVGNHDILAALGADIGLPDVAVREVLASGKFADTVNDDIAEAQWLGIRGVPFFVFDRQYAVSGAQPVSIFLQTLESVYNPDK